jgi:adenosine deaminase
MDTGIPGTLSTDDPPFFGTGLLREWTRGRDELGLSLGELRRRLLLEFMEAGRETIPAIRG